jgi:hypothetical protein
MAQITLTQDGVALGMRGTDGGAGPFICATGTYNASSVDATFFVAPRAMRVETITGRVTVAGTDGGAVTAQIRKVPSGTAITSGTVLHSGTYNLKGTADTNQALTVSTTAATLLLAAGDALAIDFTGTLTSATGAVTVGMTPV